jgi:hypothetical protein
MKNLKESGASAPSIPSVRQLKDEAKAKRIQSAATGKKMPQNVALKEVARKYGHKSWESAEAAANSRIASSNTPIVLLFKVDGFDECLIINRKLIATSRVGLGDRSLKAMAMKMAFSLGVALKQDGCVANHDSAHDKKGWRLTSFLIKRGLIDPEVIPLDQISEGDALVANMSALDIVEVEQSSRASVEYFNNALAIAKQLPEYANSSAPWIRFTKAVDSFSDQEDPNKNVECLAVVEINVMDHFPTYSIFYIALCSEGKVLNDHYDAMKYFAQCEECATDILSRLHGLGLNLKVNNLNYDPPFRLPASFGALLR